MLQPIQNLMWKTVLCGILSFAFLQGCNTTKIKGHSNRRPAVTKPSFSLRTLSAATKTTNGQGELLVTSPFDMEVQCTNCQSLALDFAKVQPVSGSGNAVAAKFSYPLVDRTYICKARLRVTFDLNNSVKEYIYGIYFCPENSSGQRTCSKAAAVEKCGF